jgi:hypothetical protein
LPVSCAKSFADSFINSLAFKYFTLFAATLFDFVAGTVIDEARIAFTCKKSVNKKSWAVNLNLIYFGVCAKVDDKLIFPKVFANFIRRKNASK